MVNFRFCHGFHISCPMHIQDFDVSAFIVIAAVPHFGIKEGFHQSHTGILGFLASVRLFRSSSSSSL